MLRCGMARTVEQEEHGGDDVRLDKFHDLDGILYEGNVVWHGDTDTQDWILAPWIGRARLVVAGCLFTLAKYLLNLYSVSLVVLELAVSIQQS